MPTSLKIRRVWNLGLITGCLIRRVIKYRRHRYVNVGLPFPGIPFAKICNNSNRITLINVEESSTYVVGEKHPAGCCIIKQHVYQLLP